MSSFLATVLRSSARLPAHVLVGLAGALAMALRSALLMLGSLRKRLCRERTFADAQAGCPLRLLNGFPLGLVMGLRLGHFP